MRPSQRRSTATPRVSVRSNFDYKLYAVNYHGSGLNSIRDEFIKTVQSGLRRKVFVIDLDAEVQRATHRRSQGVRSSQNIDPSAIAVAAIDRCRREFNNITKTINDEERFDLTNYWMSNMVTTTDTKDGKGGKGTVTAVKMPDKPKEAPKTAKGSKSLTQREASISFNAPECPKITPREHNKVGRAELLSKKKYIADEPINSKLFIIIIGGLNYDFIQKLISQRLPLHAVINYIPGTSRYDLLMPNPENERFIAHTIEQIQADIYKMRQIVDAKSVGFFQHKLPVISRCLARKYSQQLFDELCFYVYDIETIQRQYQSYYFDPFHEYDVAMPPSVMIPELQSIAESLSMQGHYLNEPLPGVASDDITVAMYFEGILTQLGKATHVRSSGKVFPLTVHPLSLKNASAHLPKKVFKYLLRIPHYNRLCIDETNEVLTNLITYVDHNNYQNFYNAAMEHHLLHKYFCEAVSRKNLKFRAYSNETSIEPFPLPRFVKLYLNRVGTVTSLNRWLMEYENVDIEEIHPNCKLYHFYRNYNEVIENDQLICLPSRLCFRDFTLFQLEEFHENLMTPEMAAVARGAKMSEEDRLHEALKARSLDLDPSIFIRFTSLKWRDIQVKVMNPPMLPKAKSATASRLRADTRTSAKGSAKWSFQGKENTVHVGLPPNHHLLQGYNLEDIRQEIHTKTTKYYFEEGGLFLYEERWCFKDMNKTLTANFHNNKLCIYRPINPHTAEISSNIRLINKNNVQIRLLNRDLECAKVVINYPNGLAIYHLETYVEQEWLPPTNHNNEVRRIYTQYGMVIVHYHDADLITLLRYNGEVYQLYQYSLLEEEEEAAWEEEEWTKSSALNIELRDSTMQKSAATLKESEKNKPKATDKERDKSKEKNRASESDKDKERKRSKSQIEINKEKSRSTVKEAASAFSDMSDKSPPQPQKKSLKQLLIESIDDELKFLNEMSKRYDLKYLHLVVTTSTGRIVNLTHTGKVYGKKSRPTLEWHDYYANESYAMRSDGVRMIWTADMLKCYHSDGTLIVTRTEELVEYFEVERTATNITMSSSHLNEEEEGGGDSSLNKSSRNILPSNMTVEGASTGATFGSKSYNTYISAGGEGEEFQIADRSYVYYRCEDYLIQHDYYAAVQFTVLADPINIVSATIFAIDDIRVQVGNQLSFDDLPRSEHESEYTEIPIEETLTTEMNSSTSVTVPRMYTTRTSKNLDTRTTGTELQTSHTDYSNLYCAMEDVMTMVKVSLGDELSIILGEDMFTMTVELDHMKGDFKTRDVVKLQVDFNRNLTDLFGYFVNKIANFKKYDGPKSTEFYFLERLTPKCQTRGYKFVNDLPPPTEYNFSAGNTFTELREFRSVSKKMRNDYIWYTTDLKKFPRFPLQREKKPPIQETFPYVTTASLYLKVPHKLVNTDELHKFVESLDSYTFATTKRFLRDAFEYYLRPIIRRELSKRWSSNNWKIRLREHTRRLFREQQRRGLYMAMLKHKVYPKYFQFINEFFSDVRQIDFFIFVRNRCEITPEELEAERLAAEAGSKQKRRSHRKRSSGRENRLSKLERARQSHISRLRASRSGAKSEEGEVIEKPKRPRARKPC